LNVLIPHPSRTTTNKTDIYQYVETPASLEAMYIAILFEEKELLFQST
jgi:hypothetical protein